MLAQPAQDLAGLNACGLVPTSRHHNWNESAADRHFSGLFCAFLRIQTSEIHPSSRGREHRRERGAECGPRPFSRSVHRRSVRAACRSAAGALAGRLRRRRVPRCSSHAGARRARAALPASPRATGGHESSPLGSSRRARGRAGGSERRLAAQLTRRVGAAGCVAGLESAGLSRRHFAGLARSMEGTAFPETDPDRWTVGLFSPGITSRPGSALSPSGKERFAIAFSGKRSDIPREGVFGNQ